MHTKPPPESRETGQGDEITLRCNLKLKITIYSTDLEETQFLLDNIQSSFKNRFLCLTSWSEAQSKHLPKRYVSPFDFAK